MTPPVGIRDAKVGVLGLARSGCAVARLLASRGARVFASDAGSGPALDSTAEDLRALGVETQIGGHDVDRLTTCDWLVASPGIPPGASVLQEPGVAARPLFGELEVAAWFARAPIAAVTGTNGKTTTTSLLGAIAGAAGLSVAVAGNIGRPFSSAVVDEPDVAWYVLEVSSFQLARVVTFRPKVAAVLNLTPDHLDVYSTVDAYVADKVRIAENMGPEEDLCLNAEDERVAKIAEDAEARIHWFDRVNPVAAGATVECGWITLSGSAGSVRLLPVDRLTVPGYHNVQNALAAALVASLMGIEPASIAHGIERFRGVVHRLETIAEIDDVRWVNDSKATNVESTGVAMDAFDAPLIVIMGGRHKGASYAPLADALSRHGREVITIGEAADRIAADLGDLLPVVDVETLDAAVARARAIARAGDVVLLSPACSSYDQFASFEARGDRFRVLVVEHAATEEMGA